MNFVKLALENGGTIKPLIIPSELTNGTGLCNPSIFVDGDIESSSSLFKWESPFDTQL